MIRNKNGTYEKSGETPIREPLAILDSEDIPNILDWGRLWRTMTSLWRLKLG